MCTYSKLHEISPNHLLNDGGILNFSKFTKEQINALLKGIDPGSHYLKIEVDKYNKKHTFKLIVIKADSNNVKDQILSKLPCPDECAQDSTFFTEGIHAKKLSDGNFAFCINHIRDACPNDKDREINFHYGPNFNNMYAYPVCCEK